MPYDYATGQGVGNLSGAGVVDEAIRDIKEQAVNPRDFASDFARGNDDQPALLAAAAKATFLGAPLWLPPLATINLGARLNLGATPPPLIVGNGATIKKQSTMTNEMVVITGGTLRMTDLTFDGNRTGGATGNGVRATGGTIIARGVDVKSTKGSGWFVDGAGATMKLYSCSGTDNNSGTGAGHGLNANTGLVYAFDFIGDDNDGNGVLLAAGAANGCYIRASARRCGLTGGQFLSNYGRLEIYVEDCKNGVIFKDATGWQNPIVVAKDIGRAIAGTYTVTQSGTPVQLYGCSRIRGGKLVSLNPRGYALAFTRSVTIPASGAACTDCSWEIDADATEAVDVDADSDPGVHIGGGSQRIHVRGRIKRHTFGVWIGEVGTGNEWVPYSNNDNVVEIEADGCTYPAVAIAAGCRNHVKLRARDCYTTDAAKNFGLVDIATNFLATTGSITTGTNQLTLVGGPYGVGIGVKITGALAGPADLTTVIDALAGQVATLRDNATRTVSGSAVVQVPLTATVAVTNGSKTLTFSSSGQADGFKKGYPIKVAGGGAASADLYTTLDTDPSGTTATMHDAAGTSQASAALTQLFTMDNVVEFVDHASGPDAVNKPKYIVNMDANGANNEVIAGRHRGDFQTAATNVAGVGNSATVSV